MHPTRINGAFAGHFTGQIKNFGYEGHSISKGAGALKGLVETITIQQTGETTYEAYGYNIEKKIRVKDD